MLRSLVGSEMCIRDSLRYNRFIQTGYRPYPLSVTQSLRSLFRLHTETVNIWTHLVPLLVVLVAAFSTPWRDEQHTYYGLLTLFALVFGCSVLYHTFMNVQSESRYARLLMLDYAGIWMLLALCPQMVQIRWGLEKCGQNVLRASQLAYGICSLVSLAVLVRPVVQRKSLGTAMERRILAPNRTLTDPNPDPDANGIGWRRWGLCSEPGSASMLQEPGSSAVTRPDSGG
eukprot:TRINITY_DN27303_c0_g1_i2.p1 TRINITY_DN27303_c0_g1~~TRINITY_DN27303_c0_g1_i2.p1  ORF type:complete len:229 (-),score=34.05 TRINITY_DN27303_c0_g1_i2:183-869(-)